MTPSEVAEHVGTALARAEVPFLFVGSFSSNQYGIPRSTQDVDLVVQLPGNRLAELGNILGPEFVAVEQMRFETTTGTVCQEFTVRSSPMKVEVFALSTDEHDLARFERRVGIPLFGTTIDFPTPEDVIVWKLRWGRPKDLDDIRGVILVQSRQGDLDWGYITTWCERHGTLETLRNLIESLPERVPGWEARPE